MCARVRLYNVVKDYTAHSLTLSYFLAGHDKRIKSASSRDERQQLTQRRHWRPKPVPGRRTRKAPKTLEESTTFCFVFFFGFWIAKHSTEMWGELLNAGRATESTATDGHHFCAIHFCWRRGLLGRRAAITVVVEPPSLSHPPGSSLPQLVGPLQPAFYGTDSPWPGSYITSWRVSKRTHGQRWSLRFRLLRKSRPSGSPSAPTDLSACRNFPLYIGAGHLCDSFRRWI